MLRTRVGARCLLIFMLFCSIGQCTAVAQGMTAVEALKTAQQTGRPLLAIATSPTCGPCLSLKSVIHGDENLRPLLDEFVYLEMDHKSPEFAEFRARFPGDVSGVPMVYMIRGDGAVLYGQSGSLRSEQLAQLLSHGIQNSGTMLRADQLASLEAAHKTARRRAGTGDLVSAMTTVAYIAELDSFAQVVQQAQATREQLHDLIIDWLERLDASIAAGDAVHANAYRLAELYVELPKSATRLRSTARRLLDEYESNHSTRTAIVQNKRLVRARLEEQRDLCDAAIASYRLVRELAPNSPAGEFAAERLNVVQARRQKKLTSNLGAAKSSGASASAVP